MAMAASWTGKRKLVSKLASAVWQARRAAVSSQQLLVNSGQRALNWTAAEKCEYFIPHPRLYGTSQHSAKSKFCRSTGYYNYDLAVNKAIKEYHKQVKEEKDGMVYPSRGTSQTLGGLKMFHILLKTTGGGKYICICVAPHLDVLIDTPVKLDEESIKLLFFKKLDSTTKVSIPFDQVVGDMQLLLSPRDDPHVTPGARFALAQHNKEEKLLHVIQATTQMVSNYELLRMRLKGEYLGRSSVYEAIVSVPQNDPENMELVLFKEGIDKNCRFFGQRLIGDPSLTHSPLHQYKYEEFDDSEDEDEFHEINTESDESYGYDECRLDDPRIISAARFAVSQHNKEDELRRVIEAVSRTYLGEEILHLSFEIELDAERYYEAIVIAPLNKPEDMRLAFFGRSDDDYEYRPKERSYDELNSYEKIIRAYECKYECDDVDVEGSIGCRTDDRQVIAAARSALFQHFHKKDKVRRVIKASRELGSEYVIIRVKFESELRIRPFLAVVLIPIGHPKHMALGYMSGPMR